MQTNSLSDASIILLGILSTIFMCIGIFINDKKNKFQAYGEFESM